MGRPDFKRQAEELTDTASQLQRQVLVKHMTAVLEQFHTELAAANAKLAAKPDVVPVCYMRMLNGKPDWSEDCVGTEVDLQIDNYDPDDGYTAEPLYSRDALLSLSAQLAEKEAECEGLLKDAERLDWLDSAESSLVGGSTTDGTIRWGFTTPDPGIEWTLRAAIDAAIAAREKP